MNNTGRFNPDDIKHCTRHSNCYLVRHRPLRVVQAGPGQRYARVENHVEDEDFQRDLDYLLCSKYGIHRQVIVDEKVREMGFVVPDDADVRYLPRIQCLKLLKSDGWKYTCLTFDRAFWESSPGYYAEADSGFKAFRCPELNGCGDICVAEIHAAWNICSKEVNVLEIPEYYRISVYKLNGQYKTVRRVARFERGNVIDEKNLNPGESLGEALHHSHFSGPGDYRRALGAEGIGFGINCCAGVSQIMGKYNLTFNQVMELSHLSERRQHKCKAMMKEYNLSFNQAMEYMNMNSYRRAKFIVSIKNIEGGN